MAMRKVEDAVFEEDFVDDIVMVGVMEVWMEFVIADLGEVVGQ